MLAKAWLKQSRALAGTLTKAQAEAKAQRFLDEHAESVPDDRKTFGRACDDFIVYCKRERSLRASTVHDYRRIADRLWERSWRPDQAWRERPLDTFTDDDVLAVREELIEADRSPDTLNHHRRIIRGAFGTRTNSPALAWDWMAIKPDSEGKLRFYDPAQVRRLKEHANDQRDAAIYTLATEEGPRMSEILGLKVGNVDFEVDRIRFEDGYTIRGGHAGTKGRRVRSVPMTANTRAALWPYCAGRGKAELVFEHPRKAGEPICGVSLYRRFVSACKRAGLPPIRFHDLRHTFGTQAIRKVDIYTLQRLMGHAHITTTERYLHYAPDPTLAATLSGLWESEDSAENVVPLSEAS